jgi:hypothetical protein
MLEFRVVLALSSPSGFVSRAMMMGAAGFEPATSRV